MLGCSPSAPCWNAPTCTVQTNSRWQLFKLGEKRRRRLQFLSTTITIMSLCYRGALHWGVSPTPCPSQVTQPLHSTACVFSLHVLCITTNDCAGACVHLLGAQHNKLLTSCVCQEVTEEIYGKKLIIDSRFLVLCLSDCKEMSDVKETPAFTPGFKKK